jgi:hypothetical protein
MHPRIGVAWLAIALAALTIPPPGFAAPTYQAQFGPPFAAPAHTIHKLAFGGPHGCGANLTRTVPPRFSLSTGRARPGTTTLRVTACGNASGSANYFAEIGVEWLNFTATAGGNHHRVEAVWAPRAILNATVTLGNGTIGGSRILAEYNLSLFVRLEGPGRYVRQAFVTAAYSQLTTAGTLQASPRFVRFAVDLSHITLVSDQNYSISTWQFIQLRVSVSVTTPAGAAALAFVAPEGGYRPSSQLISVLVR